MRHRVLPMMRVSAILLNAPGKTHDLAKTAKLRNLMVQMELKESCLFQLWKRWAKKSV